MIQQFHLSVFIQRKWKHLKRCLHPYVHCRIICSNQEMETSKCLLMDEWIKMCCISQLYKYEYYSAIKKEGNPAICDYMDELWRHYTKWSKPDRKTSVAAAKLRQSCLTLCDPIDGSPPGSRPWDSPGKNTGVCCHVLPQCMKVKSESEVAQSRPTLRDPMDCSPESQASLSMGFPRQEYWSGLPLPSPRQVLYDINYICNLKQTHRDRE